MTALLLETASIVPSQTDPARSAIHDFLGLQQAGLSADYFVAPDLSGTIAATRIDSTVAFDGSAATVPAGTGSARWMGMLLAPNNDDYTFYVRTSGNVQVWVDDADTPLVLMLDATSGEWSSSAVALKASQLYNLRLEVTQLGSPAVAELRWSSASTPKGILPSSNLYPSTGLNTFTARFHAVGQNCHPGR